MSNPGPIYKTSVTGLPLRSTFASYPSGPFVSFTTDHFYLINDSRHEEIHFQDPVWWQHAFQGETEEAASPEERVQGESVHPGSSLFF